MSFPTSFRSLLFAWILAIAPASAVAQVVINAPPTVIGDGFLLDDGETLNVSTGGVVGHGFRANDGSIVNIVGGNVGLDFSANGGSEVNISGGNVGSIDGALVGAFRALANSLVNISGGTLGDGFAARSGSEVNISGGTLGREFQAALGSRVQLLGGDFRLNGVEFTGDHITLKRSVDVDAVFSGTLADGSTFVFSPLAGNIGDMLEGVTLTRVTLPTADLGPQVIDSPVTGGPSGLRSGQSLTVRTGGKLRNNFAVIDATLTVEGGAVGRNTETIGSVVNVTDGSVGDFLFAYAGSKIDVSGGVVGFRFEAFESEVNITGGTVGEVFTAHSGSVVSISGGAVRSVRAESGSEIHISGGTTGAGFSLYNSVIAYSGAVMHIAGGTVGSAFNAAAGSDVELVGGEFRLNGAEYSGGSITLGSEDIFTGTLADGSSFIFSPLNGDNLQAVTLTPALLPPVDLSPIVIDGASICGVYGLRAGQTLTVKNGGELGDNFAVVDATLNIDGGTVGGGVEVAGGIVNLAAGGVGPELSATRSIVNMTGGTLGERSSANLGSVVNISGGMVDSKFYAAPGSEVNISGGVIAFDFWARSGSDVEFIGGEFQLNGVAYAGNSVTLGDNDVFTGTFEDGSPFVFSSMANPLGDELQGVKLTRTTLPPIDLLPGVVNGSVGDAPSGLRAGQTLTLQSGGELQNHFAAVGATLNIERGAVGEGLEVSQSTVNVSGGTVGDWFQAYDSQVNISGGKVGHFSAHPGTSVHIDGGVLASVWSFAPTKSVAIDISGDAVIGYLDAYKGSVVNMSGGTVEDYFGVGSAVATITGGDVRGGVNVNNNSTVNILGGTIGGNFTTTSSPGTEINVSGGSVAGFFTISSAVKFNLFGSHFLLDGIPLNGLQVGNAFRITERNVNLSGVLTDGTRFSFYLDSHTISEGFFSSSAIISVTLVVPEPGSACLIAIGLVVLVCNRGRRS